MENKTPIVILEHRIEAIYQVDYGTEDDGDEYIVKRINKDGDETWKIIALYNGEIISNSSKIGKELINHIKQQDK